MNIYQKLIAILFVVMSTHIYGMDPHTIKALGEVLSKEIFIKAVESMSSEDLMKSVQETINQLVLYTAAALNDSDTIRDLLENKKNLDINFHSNKTYCTPLQIAAHLGNSQAIDVLIKNGANTQLKTSDNRTIGQLIATSNLDDQDHKRALLLQILKPQAPREHTYIVPVRAINELDEKNQDYIALLLRICAINNYEWAHAALEYLISHGFDMSHPKMHSSNTLFLAAYYNNIKSLQLLLNAGVSTALRAPEKNNKTALHGACTSQVVHILLDNGADINALDNTGSTPLLIAINQKNYEVIQALLERGAHVDMRHEKHKSVTPLAIALALDEDKIVELLIQYNAFVYNNPDDILDTLNIAVHGKKIKCALFLDTYIRLHAAAGKKHRSALHRALDYKASADFIKKIIDNNPTNVNQYDDCGLQPLHKAVLENNLEVAEFLLQKGADSVGKTGSVSANTKNYVVWPDQTPLDIAIEKNCIEMGSLICRYRNSNDNKRNPLTLHESVIQEHEDVLAYLLNNDMCAINSCNSHNNTALHLAVKKNNSSMVKLLLRYKPSIFMLNKAHQTPIDIALDYQCQDIIAILQKYNPDAVKKATDNYVQNNINNNCLLEQEVPNFTRFRPIDDLDLDLLASSSTTSLTSASPATNLASGSSTPYTPTTPRKFNATPSTIPARYEFNTSPYVGTENNELRDRGYLRVQTDDMLIFEDPKNGTTHSIFYGKRPEHKKVTTSLGSHGYTNAIKTWHSNPYEILAEKRVTQPELADVSDEYFIMTHAFTYAIDRALIDHGYEDKRENELGYFDVTIALPGKMRKPDGSVVYGHYNYKYKKEGIASTYVCYHRFFEKLDRVTMNRLYTI